MSHPLVRRLRDLLLRTWTSVLAAPLAACFAIGLIAVEAVMHLLSSEQQTALARAASTNITHLALDPLFVLPASAFVDLGNGWLWLPLSLILLGGLERKLGSGRALLITFGAHVLATIVSEGVLLLQIAWHAAPRSDVEILDVGPSYVLFAALTACLVLGSWKLRAAALVSAAIVIPGVFAGADGLDMTVIGHASALALGALFALAASDRGRAWIASKRPAMVRPQVALPEPATA